VLFILYWDSHSAIVAGISLSVFSLAASATESNNNPEE
jgi:hypothetical protein